MGNTWKGISDEKLQNSEKELLLHGNKLKLEDLIFENVNLDGRPGSENYIHEVTLKGKREGLPKLVMIHGFGGGGAIFCNMLPYL